LGVKVDYGINRKMDSGNFFDVYFGEFLALGRAVFNAPGLTNKVRYLIMPPGWHHSGEHRTAAIVRDGYLEHSAIQD
jgi:hypothetical protein